VNGHALHAVHQHATKINAGRIKHQIGELNDACQIQPVTLRVVWVADETSLPGCVAGEVTSVGRSKADTNLNRLAWLQAEG